MIDSHCHLDQEPLLENFDEIIYRSKNIGIKKLLTICTTFDSFKKICDLVKKDEIIYGTYGIHPHETEKNIVNKTEVEIGLRGDGKVEVLSGLNLGDKIVAEGLKKVRPRGEIKPIKK